MRGVRVRVRVRVRGVLERQHMLRTAELTFEEGGEVAGSLLAPLTLSRLKSGDRGLYLMWYSYMHFSPSVAAPHDYCLI